MAITIKHNKSTSVIPIKNTKCKAFPITDILPGQAWKDKTCFLIGGGPSLANFDFELIRNELSIGVNKSFTKFPTTVNYIMDTRFYDTITYPSKDNVDLHRKWKQYTGIKVFLRHSVKFKFDSSVYYVNNLTSSCLSLNLKKGIWGGNNSGFGALMLACALGCKRIGLLGYSMKVQGGGKKIKTHWHSGYSFQNVKSFQPKLDKFKTCFDNFADVIAAQGIEVVNLVKKSEDSALECFPKDSLDNFLSKSKIGV